MAQKSEISIETNGAQAQKPNPPSPKSRLAMLKRTKKASTASSDPFRFQNNGITYKGKLIGEQDVDKARGDAMCMEAMRNAKGLVKAAGAHKTRITLQINIDGIKVLDEKSGAVLHNFPVSRISFIARDSSDARAFGLVYGEPGGKYKFYGIKTASSADQAVLAIRDMFQVVFEMKKKQIEQVKQQQQLQGTVEGRDVSVQKEKQGGVAVADLLDLESELQQIEQGVQQLSTVPTSFDAFGASPFGDPFADSFNTTTNTSATNTTAPLNMSGVSGSFQQHHHHQNQYQPQQAWPTDAWATPPTMMAPPPPAHPQIAPMHHAQSTPALGGFADTNPFASAFGAAPPATAAAPLMMMAPPPSSTTAPAPFRDPFAVQPTSGQIDWNGTSAGIMTKENQVPMQQQPSMHHANTFANFGDQKRFRFGAWEEKKVTSLEEAFTKLVDMDALVVGGNGGGHQETKKNPFEHILNPPKASLNALSTTTCSSAAQMQAHQKQQVTSDPFGDDFFR